MPDIPARAAVPLQPGTPQIGPSALPYAAHFAFAQAGSQVPINSGGEQLVEPSGWVGPGIERPVPLYDHPLQSRICQAYSRRRKAEHGRTQNGDITASTVSLFAPI